MLDTRERRGDGDAMRLAWAGDHDDPVTVLEVFRPGGPQNLARYANPAYDGLLDRASMAIDPAHRLEPVTAAKDSVLSDYPVAPLHFCVSKHLVERYVGGFEDNALDRHPSRCLTLDAGD